LNSWAEPAFFRETWGIVVYRKHNATTKPAGAPRQINKRVLLAVLASAAFVVSGCASSAEQPAAPTTNSTTDQPATGAGPTGVPAIKVTPGSTPTTAEPAFPPAVAPSALQHGGTYWGVYVTVVRTSDDYQVEPADQKRLDVAKKTLTDLGYEPEAGAYDIDCEQGMREQLHLDPQRDYGAVRIFFATRDQAAQFVEEYQPGIVGTAKVILYCMD
jgi:hypothetical protein